MYGAIDIGGTKTLVAVFDAQGKIVEQQKFITPKIYEDFKIELAKAVANMSTKEYYRTACGVPGTLDRERGVAVSCGNLDWKNITIAKDIEEIFVCPTFIENDAKLAALYESKQLDNIYKRVLYVTISTGIGIAVIDNGQIDENIGDRGGRSILLEHDGTIQPWEDFASGKAIVKKYGKLASEIDDEKTWKQIVRTFGLGLVDLTAVVEPEIIIIGGGVGAHFNKFGKFLKEDIAKYETPLMQIPPIVKAKHPEEAVIYGCYEYAKQHER